MSNQHISKIYDYKDADGNLLFQVVRFEPKGFAQRRPFNDGFVWGLGEVEPVLYRLPEVLQGIKDCETIYICEGEKDADNLSALGFIATTCPMGAGKWQKTYTESFQGCCEAVIVADKDEPGRAHARSIAEALVEAGIFVKVIELPDIDGTPVKDISDWLNAGGTPAAFLEILKQCPHWSSSSKETDASVSANLQNLISQYGDPYYLSKDGAVTAINQSFWASLHQAEHIQLFEPDEREFYRYNPESGLYSVISEDTIKQEIAARLLDVSREQGLPSLERKRNNSIQNHIVAQLKGISEKKNAFRRDNTIVHLSNGVIVFKNNGEADFCSFSPDYCSRNQCPIPFDASAKCDRFFDELLIPSVSANDALLLQKYTGLCLLGNNLIQKLLILDGKPGRGKSTLALIIQKLVGQINVTEMRTQHLSERFELFRYLKKNLLVGVDVPGRFLSEKGAYVIKGLVGGDWFDAEQKCGTGSFPFQGNFCILITSNSRLQVRLDGDTGAWKRRLLIIRFEAHRHNMDACLKKLDALFNMRLNEEIGAEEYAKKKEDILKEKQKYEELIGDTQARAETWLDRADKAFMFAETAKKRFDTGTLEDKRYVLSCLGTKLVLHGKKLQFEQEKCLAMFECVAPDVQSLHNRLEPTQLVDSTASWEALYAQNKKWGRWLKQVRKVLLADPMPFNPLFYQQSA